jgi:RND family efflux transporter MFP subunit
MKHGSVWLCIALAGVVPGGCRSADAPPAAAPPAVVVAPPLVLRLSEWDEYTGRFEATDRVDVRARVDGYLDSIHFRDGAIVRPGDLLFVIDPRPYEALLEGARADVVRAQTRVELATTDLTRGESLFAIRGISQEEFDRRAQARKEADASLIVARATERVAALNVEFTRVRAPIGGRISQKFVSVGNVISGGQAGSTLLTTIVAVDPIQFVFDASESDYLKYNRMNASGERRTSRDTANPVRIRLLDEPSFTHVGKMDFVDNRVDPATGTIRGRAIVPNPGGFAADATAEIALAEYERTVLSALEEAERAITAYVQERERFRHLDLAARSARAAADLARQRFQFGADNFLTVLDAERVRLDAEDRLAQSRVEVTRQAATIFKALGGGWSEAERLTSAQLADDDRERLQRIVHVTRK